MSLGRRLGVHPSLIGHGLDLFAGRLLPLSLFALFPLFAPHIFLSLFLDLLSDL